MSDLNNPTRLTKAEIAVIKANIATLPDSPSVFDQGNVWAGMSHQFKGKSSARPRWSAVISARSGSLHREPQADVKLH